MTYNPEKAKADRDEWRRQGLCTACGKRPAFGHYKRCPACIERGTLRSARYRDVNRDRISKRGKESRRRLIENGKCPMCRKPNPDPTRVYCPRCRIRDHAMYLRRYIPSVRPEGVCLRCDRPTHPGWKLCEVHRAMAAAAGEKGRAAQDRNRHPWRLDENARRIGAGRRS